MIYEVDLVDHEGDEVQSGNVLLHKLAQSGLGGGHERRETTERDVPRLLASTADPTGSSPAPYLRMDTLASIFFMAIQPTTSVEVTSS